MIIKNVTGREIYDSRGWPTILCEITLDDDSYVYGVAPSGASRGSHEAKELRDGDQRLSGHGVQQAIQRINEHIAPLLCGREPHAVEMDLKLIECDGTIDKSFLGGNTMIAASMALYRAQAHVEGMELYELIAQVCGFDTVSLPLPMFNCINGGMHAENMMTIQEFMVIPAQAKSFTESVEAGAAVYHQLGAVLREKGYRTSLGDEGGFAPDVVDAHEALDCLSLACERAGKECLFAIDVAASRLYDAKTSSYYIDAARFGVDGMIKWYEDMCKRYPVVMIEDGLAQDDWDGWRMLRAHFADRVHILGDDITVTNPERINEAAQQELVQGVIIKPNQIGTVTETLHAMQVCRDHQLSAVVSHRSGETEDTFIADLAVGAQAGQIKAGGLSRSERLAKYNRLLMIEDHLRSFAS